MEGALRDGRTLGRIVAMLVALAVLAERAGSRSFPVRWLVLAILRRAEAAARAFVVEATQTDWPCFEDPLEIGSSPVDAACLALRFRALAAALVVLLGWGCRFGGRPTRIDGAPRHLVPRPRRLPMTLGGWRPFDTS